MTLLSAILTLLTFTSPLTVTMPHTPAGIVVPQGIAAIGGVEWVSLANARVEWFPQPTLAGYTVTLGGIECGIIRVFPVAVVFVVPNLPAGTHTLVINGPAGTFTTDVQVERYYPRLAVQPVLGETDPECCAIATSSWQMFPRLYLGEPVPTGFTIFSYVTLQAWGVVNTNDLNAPPVFVHLQRADGENYTIPARAFGDPFPGLNNVHFFSPACSNGEYRATLIMGERRSNAAIVRFTSDCTKPVSIERGEFRRVTQR